MALSMIESMKTLAQQGKAILCTIHQPSSEIFGMFDKLCLLSEGKLAFIGSVDGATNFFNKLGYQMPNNYNPADFFIKMLALKPNDKDRSYESIKVTGQIKKLKFIVF
jgi:ATP-binding cassette, subfamily G (WHITE), eye pigment precursor transporter